MDGLAMGRIVFYYQNSNADPRVAIVTRLLEDEDNAVDLYVFPTRFSLLDADHRRMNIRYRDAVNPKNRDVLQYWDWPKGKSER